MIHPKEVLAKGVISTKAERSMSQHLENKDFFDFAQDEQSCQILSNGVNHRFARSLTDLGDCCEK